MTEKQKKQDKEETLKFRNDTPRHGIIRSHKCNRRITRLIKNQQSVHTSKKASLRGIERVEIHSHRSSLKPSLLLGHRSAWTLKTV